MVPIVWRWSPNNQQSAFHSHVKKQKEHNRSKLFLPSRCRCCFLYSPVVLLPNKTSEDHQIPEGQCWCHPPVSPLNPDLWRDQRKNERKRQGPWCKLCDLKSACENSQELHIFLESDSLWPNSERLGARKEQEQEVCRNQTSITQMIWHVYGSTYTDGSVIASTFGSFSLTILLFPLKSHFSKSLVLLILTHTLS